MRAFAIPTRACDKPVRSRRLPANRMHIIVEKRQEVIARGHGLFNHCHASTLVAFPSHDLLAAYFAGPREGDGGTAIWLSRRRGDAWGAPVRAFAEPGLAHWNPVLHADGARLILFYKVGTTVHDWITRRAESRDGGATWSIPRPLVPGDQSPRGPVRNKLLVLSDGAWLAGGSIETPLLWDAFVDRSDDGGATWRRADIPFAHRAAARCDAAGTWHGLRENTLWESDPDRVFQWDGVIQPALWEFPRGQVHMLLRSTRGRVFRSDSSDSGTTWCAAYPTSLPNNNSGLDLAHLGAGRLVLAYNPVEGNWGSRTPLSLAASNDNGATWSQLLDLETGNGEFSYPAIIVAGNCLHLAYTWNRKTIVYHRLRPA
jgi:predicted neuraminidase